MSALVLVAAFALVGLDPVTQVFAWMAGTATLGVLALMALTCLAVLVFFRRERVDTRPWQTLVAPALGLAGLAVFLWLTISNFPLLIGGSAGTRHRHRLRARRVLRGRSAVRRPPTHRRRPGARRRPRLTAGGPPMTIAETRPTTATHPLEMATAAEVDAVRTALADAGLLGENVRFAFFAPEEPPKAEVLAHTDGDDVDRRFRGRAARPRHGPLVRTPSCPRPAARWSAPASSTRRATASRRSSTPSSS